MARVVAFVPDLLFGSNVVGALRAAGHEPLLVAEAGSLREALLSADALVLDLTADAEERIGQAREALPAGTPVLAFYSHVEAEVRAGAEQAGFELTVPRSRMAREGPALLERLLREARGDGGGEARVKRR